MTSQLQRAVEVMDRLRSPGGCPWDAEQTHESLTRYLLEETYEVLEAIETGDLALLREELGDLLLQVLFHARIAQERSPDSAFGIEDVAQDLADKLIRRHPHVFADATAGDADELNETWERQKILEKGRTSAVDGVPLGQPALALSAKLLARATRAGLDVRPDSGDDGVQEGRAERAGSERAGSERAGAERDGAERADPTGSARSGSDAAIGERLFAVVQDAVELGVDPEAALRRTARAYRAAIRRAESG